MAIIYGTTRADKKTGTQGNDLIHGWASGGNASSPSGNDTLNGAAGHDTLYGGTGNDSLIGGTGNDTLSGNAGSDIFNGGADNDTYIIDSTTDKVTEAASSGTDTVQSYISYTLGSNLEKLTLIGTGAINGTGNSLNNTIIGNTANNTLNGGGGNDTVDGGLGSDTLNGGTGNDTYIIEGTNDSEGFLEITDSVTEAANSGTDTVQLTILDSSPFIEEYYSLDSNVENLTLKRNGYFVSVLGNSLDNILIGGDADNNLGRIGPYGLSGGDGNDQIYGEAGNDGLYGGLGSDTLYGGTGDDTLAGHDDELGSDILLGSTGNDTYVVNSASDSIIEYFNEGTDTVRSFINYTLGDNSNLEGINLLDAISATGNSLDNSISGDFNNNFLYGGEGNDFLAGYSTFYTIGPDEVSDDYLDGQAGNDTLEGGYGNDSLYGGQGNDSLGGSFGNDTLSGGGGNDTLSGGEDANNFGFNSLDEGIDTITDFVVADDTILVSADSFGSGLIPGVAITPAQFRIGSAAGDARSRFIYNQKNGALFFDSDGTGVLSQVQFATLSPGLALSYADIFVVAV